ncbi:MAG: Uma2 family endonuclease [Myxococcota bacterium]|nr:Uma2 family endonuclease [Myxococcota bacterium]
MTLPARRTATYADIEALPENLVGEIIGGELHTQPRPSGPHAAVASLLGMVLGNPFHRGSGGPGGWIILDEPELHLGADILVPDLAGWRRTRMPEVPDIAAFEIAPDWVAEILSPSTAAVDRVEKLPIYAREHVPHVWLIDPRLQTLEAFALAGPRYELLGAWRGAEVARVAPFDAMELELAALWAR